VVLLLKLAGANRTPSAKRTPIYSESTLQAAFRELSELWYKEVLDDFRVARTLVRNCRAERVFELGADDIKAMANGEDGPPAEQIDLLERLGFLERITVDEDGQRARRFRIPRLYTGCWDSAS
jgi:hypothetical protein